ncbi:magnesium/cobalt transporter CorA [Bradyrhizobium sp.]|uniref:magnesium/cobalt transporter CorA n=1 Tax=Bradyrhizobium sp. TaxID=376 RepID=UPI002DDCD6CD|nr:magnesium/cobalt transporter CorA [Bradyrhizobium sp.]HEV2159316.1 magnesium/cobalt transporter CorA [Bradyrhizobium sp.]
MRRAESGFQAPSSPTNEPGVVAASVYAGGHRVTDIEIDEAETWSKKKGHVVWIGLHEPSMEVLQRVAVQLHLHPLAIEDASNAHQQPKVEQYGDALFVVARTAQMAEGHIAFGETHLFVGKGYVVSVRHGASTSYKAVRARCESCPTSLSQGEDYILYAILDFSVDNYRPVIDSIQIEVERLEEDVLKKSLAHRDFDHVYRLRRDLLRLRRAVGPLIDVCKRLDHVDLIAMDDDMKPLFRDVLDHARRAEEDIDSLREILAFVFEATMMAGQAQQTDIARRLAAWAAILAVPTAVAGIYGMNFEHMPELKWEYGYYMVLTGILGVCAILFLRFRRNGWL